MPKYKPQHARLLFIDRKIREKLYPNCSSLAGEWEASPKTIQRDLEYMRDTLNAPLIYSAKNREYYYSEEQYHLPAINIKESDLFAIFLADKLLEQYEGTPIYNSLRSIFKKIEDSLPDNTVIRPSSDHSLFTVIAPFSTVILPEVLEIVFEGLRSSSTLDIEYQVPGKVPVSRRIDPYHGVRYEGDWYVVGFCHLRCEIRTFSLSRILNAKKSNNKFAKPNHFDFRIFSGNHFGVHWGKNDIDVKILFNKEAAAYIKERQWHPSQILEYNSDGSVILSMTVNHILELKRWILSWGETAQVIEPPSLVENVRKSILSMSALY